MIDVTPANMPTFERQPTSDGCPWPDVLLVGKREAARILGVSERTVYNLRETSGLPFVRIGRLVLYSPAALREWVESKLERGDGVNEQA